MKKFKLLLVACITFYFGMAFGAEGFHDFTVKNSHGKDVKLSDFKGKAVLVVNVASKCGFTKQYDGLQKLFAKYKDKGLQIVGFPSNQFMGQEPGTNEEIQKFCKLNYGVDFPIYSKVDVNGADAIPLYKWLTSQKDHAGPITWNFNKFLIGRDGKVISRFDSKETPEEIDPKIAKYLAAK